jgi:hypothetical protein
MQNLCGEVRLNCILFLSEFLILKNENLVTDYQEVHLNWDQEPALSLGAQICAFPNKANWTIDDLTAKNCQRLDTVTKLTNQDDPNPVMGHIAIWEGNQYSAAYADTLGDVRSIC